MAGMFRSGESLLEQGLDLARRRDFVHAREKLLAAATKLSKAGAARDAALAWAYAELFRLSGSGPDPGAMVNLAGHLRGSLGQAELRPGPRSITAPELAVQLELAAAEVGLLQAVYSGAGDRASLAAGLQKLANDYRQLGSQVLFLPELWTQQSIPAESKPPMFLALSFETLGMAAQTSDPLIAAEHFQTAQQYWAQAGDAARAAQAGAQVEKLALRAKCWFCGREGTGHGVQFVSMPIDVEVSGLEGANGSPLPSVNPGGRYLYVCKACNSSVRLLAERVAQTSIAEMAQQLRYEMRMLELRLRSGSASGSR